MFELVEPDFKNAAENYKKSANEREQIGRMVKDCPVPETGENDGEIEKRGQSRWSCMLISKGSEELRAHRGNSKATDQDGSPRPVWRCGPGGIFYQIRNGGEESA